MKKQTAHSSTPLYTLHEELANAITHGIGAVLAVVGTVFLILLAVWSGDWWRILSVTIYGFSMVLLYTASTLYHSFMRPHIKRWLRKLDHAAIYLLIAGTYTPFVLIALRQPRGIALLVAVWIMALSGIIFKLFYTGRYDRISTLFYVGMGWSALWMIGDLMEVLPPPGLVWMVAGGLSYTGGVVFYLWQRLPFNHAIWHLFVLGGTVCHYVAVLLVV
jgi:hemolysin III